MIGCEALVQNAALGVAPALRAVDCVSASTAAGAFGRLFGGQGALQPALTLALTIYIALFAFALLSGRSRLTLAALSPRMVTVGVVLTFATSWLAYQSVVWNLVAGGADEIARLIMGTKASATQVFADRIDMILSAVDRIAQDAQDQSAGAPTPAPGASGLSPTTLMWLAALLLLLGTVGVLLTARIALAVLLAVGPVFIVLALFRGSRGLAAGWLRALTMTAITPLLVVIGGGVTVELVVPVIQRLSGVDGIDMRAAVALFLVASVHVALMALAVKVAGTMVAGWRVFGLTGEGASPLVARSVPTMAPAVTAFPATTSRTTAPPDFGLPMAAGVARATATQTMRREIFSQAPAIAAASMPPPRRRGHGIGSRFQPARIIR